MNLLRILVTAVLGVAAATCYAVPVQFTLEAAPFTNWQITLRNPAGMITSMNLGDTDGNGMSSFTAADDDEVVFNEVRTMPLWGVRYVPRTASGEIPFLTSLAGAPLIVDWADGAGGMFTLGQEAVVTGGVMIGVADSSVRMDPGIPTALDMLAIDLSSLPTFTGVAQVVGLMSMQLVPEPSTGALLLLAMTSMGLIARRKRLGRVRAHTSNGNFQVSLPNFRDAGKLQVSPRAPCGLPSKM